MGLFVCKGFAAPSVQHALGLRNGVSNHVPIISRMPLVICKPSLRFRSSVLSGKKEKRIAKAKEIYEHHLPNLTGAIWAAKCYIKTIEVLNEPW